MLTNPKAGDYDFDGACRPEGKLHPWARTFSVGIFQWVPRASKKGIKRGPVLKRIKGSVDNPQEVYTKAEKWIAEQVAKKQSV